MKTDRYTPAGHVIRFVTKIRPQFQGKDRPFAELVGTAFDCAPWETQCLHVQLTVLRHLDWCLAYVGRSDQTDDAKKVFGSSLQRLKAALSVRGAHAGWQQVKQTLDKERDQLVVIDSLMRAEAIIEFDREQVDDLEKRLVEALHDLESAGADEALLARFRELMAALIFGLRNMDVMGTEFAWERASTLVTEIAASGQSLKGKEKTVGSLKKLAAAVAVAVGVLHGARVASDDVAAIMSNVEEIGARALEWQERLLIEDKREVKGAEASAN